MLLFLTDEQASELSNLLAQVLTDLSYEIAATDDSRWRADLMRRRQIVHDVADALEAAAEEAAGTRGTTTAGSGPPRPLGAASWTV